MNCQSAVSCSEVCLDSCWVSMTKQGPGGEEEGREMGY
jgi:hypothetical protein